jgi:hypothetical protein
MMVWPLQSDHAAMVALYGNPDNGSGKADSKWEAAHLVSIKPPYQMVYGKAPIKTIRVNKGCSEAMLEALNGILKLYGSQAGIEAHNLHHFSGCYNFRPKRGGGSLSVHAYGAAIDLDAEHNPFRTKHFSMPKEAIKVFTDLGAEAGAHWNPPDAMHFQFARVR